MNTDDSPIRTPGEERVHDAQEPAERDLNPTAPGHRSGQQGHPGNNTPALVEELTESIQQDEN